MIRTVRILLIAAVLYAGSASFAQNEDADWNPVLTLMPEPDGTIWVNLELPAEPDNPPAVSTALAVMMGDEDPEVIEGYYDGSSDGYAEWSEYWWDALGPFGRSFHRASSRDVAGTGVCPP